MEMVIKHDCKDVVWATVSEILKKVDMGYYEPDIHQKAFEASHTTVFLYCDAQLIGFGRAISDGAYQAAIYDCAVDPAYQGKGLGKIILQNLMESISHCNVILYASPGKERFYQKHGFRKMKTGMAYFQKTEVMSERGFIE
jgi:ribosomal protein S18 acetylase RimI-like enzyme